MVWLWLALWIVVVSLAVALAFILVVGRAFGRRQGPVAEGFQATVLGIGHWLGDGEPWIVFGASWLFWVGLGTVAIVLLTR